MLAIFIILVILMFSVNRFILELGMTFIELMQVLLKDQIFFLLIIYFLMFLMIQSQVQLIWQQILKHFLIIVNFVSI